MSEENVELVRRAFDVFNTKGVDGVFDQGLVSPDIVYDVTRVEIPGIGVYRGEDEVRRFFEEDWFGAFPFEEWEIHVEQLIENRDQVVVMTRQQGRGASSGVTAALELGNILTIRDGRLARVQLFCDRDEALRVAGIRE